MELTGRLINVTSRLSTATKTGMWGEVRSYMSTIKVMTSSELPSECKDIMLFDFTKGSSVSFVSVLSGFHTYVASRLKANPAKPIACLTRISEFMELLKLAKQKLTPPPVKPAIEIEDDPIQECEPQTKPIVEDPINDDSESERILPPNTPPVQYTASELFGSRFSQSETHTDIEDVDDIEDSDDLIEPVCNLRKTKPTTEDMVSSEDKSAIEYKPATEDMVLSEDKAETENIIPSKDTLITKYMFSSEDKAETEDMVPSKDTLVTEYMFSSEDKIVMDNPKTEDMFMTETEPQKRITQSEPVCCGSLSDLNFGELLQSVTTTLASRDPLSSIVSCPESMNWATNDYMDSSMLYLSSNGLTLNGKDIETDDPFYQPPGQSPDLFNEFGSLSMFQTNSPSFIANYDMLTNFGDAFDNQPDDIGAARLQQPNTFDDFLLDSEFATPTQSEPIIREPRYLNISTQTPSSQLTTVASAPSIDKTKRFRIFAPGLNGDLLSKLQQQSMVDKTSLILDPGPKRKYVSRGIREPKDKDKKKHKKRRSRKTQDKSQQTLETFVENQPDGKVRSNEFENCELHKEIYPYEHFSDDDDFWQS